MIKIIKMILANKGLPQDCFGQNSVTRLEIFSWTALSIPWEQALQLSLDIIQNNVKVKGFHLNFAPISDSKFHVNSQLSIFTFLNKTKEKYNF